MTLGGRTLWRRAGTSAKRTLLNQCRLVSSTTAVITNLPQVVLTYDDGPDPQHTPEIMRALQGARSTATFFVLSRRAERHGSLVREALAEGHEIALHGIDHRRPTKFPPGAALQRLRDGKAMLEDITGRAVRWYRPPYGAQTISTWRATRSAGMEPVMWSATTWDWRDVDQAVRVDKALSTAQPGAILLSHDGYADASDGADDGAPPSLDKHDLAQRVLVAFRERGLSGCSLSEALVAGRPVRRAWHSR